MWADYNYSELPIIKVNLNGPLTNIDDYNDFIKKWTEIYIRKQSFSFVFDTTNCGYINVEYALKIPQHIKKLKDLETQYLEKSIIIYDSYMIQMLLKMIFNIQSPIAPVYLVHKKNFCEDIINNPKKYKDLVSIYTP